MAWQCGNRLVNVSNVNACTVAGLGPVLKLATCPTVPYRALHVPEPGGKTGPQAVMGLDHFNFWQIAANAASAQWLTMFIPIT